MKRTTVIMSMILILTMLTVSITPVLAESVTALDEVETITAESKIDKSLYETLENSKNNDSISVALWIAEPKEQDREVEITKEINSVDFEALVQKEKNGILKSLHETVSEERINDIAIEQARLVLNNDVERKLIKRNNSRILNKFATKYNLHDVFTYVSRYAPLVFAEIRKNDIFKLAMDSDIEKIYYHNKEKPALEELDEPTQEDRKTDYSEVLRDGIPTYGYWQSNTGIEELRTTHHFSGVGVKIGHIETNGVLDKTLSLFSYAQNNIYILDDEYPYINPPNANHANITAAVLVGKTSDYTGVATNARMYCNSARKYYYNNLYDLDYAFMESISDILDQNVNILNASIYFGEFVSYDIFSMFMDYIVQYFHVTVSISTGNSSQNLKMKSGATAYNVIAVGNIDDKNSLSTDDDEIHDTSIRPNDCLQYKSDICAPGHRASTPYRMVTYGGGGTSTAAPIVSGICAMLMEAKPELRNNPMLMKSVLLTSAKRIAHMPCQITEAYSFTPALSRKYGSGMVNAVYAYQVLFNNRYASYTADDWENVSTISIYIPYYSHDLLHQRRIYASISWEQEIEMIAATTVHESEFNDINSKRYYIELFDPNNTIVSSSIFEYDRKQVLGYQPTETGVYRLRITKYWASSEYSNLSVSYNKPLDA